MPRPKIIPLTPEQRARAARHSNLPAVAARELARRWPRLHDDALCLANELLCRLARRFRPQRSPSGEDGFGPYALCWLRRMLRAVLPGRAVRRRPLGGGRLVLFSDLGGLAVPRFLDRAGGPDPSHALAVATTVAAVRRHLAPRQWRLLWGRYAEDRQLIDLAAAEGVHATTAGDWVRAAAGAARGAGPA